MRDHHHRCRFEDIGQGRHTLFFCRSVHSVSPCAGTKLNSGPQAASAASSTRANHPSRRRCACPRNGQAAPDRGIDQNRKTEGSNKAKPSRDPKSCCCPVYASPDRVAGKAELALKALRLSSTTTRPLASAFSKRTRSEGTGVTRLSSSLIHRVTKHPSPEAKLTDTPPSG